MFWTFFPLKILVSWLIICVGLFLYLPLAKLAFWLVLAIDVNWVWRIDMSKASLFYWVYLKTGIISLLRSLHEQPYFLFPNFLKRSFFQKNRTGIWSFLYHLERWYFFPKNIILFLRRKMKYGLSQNIHGNRIFSLYPVKMAFLFLTNMILSSCKKAKMIFSWKNTLKNDISSIIEKENIDPRISGILLIEKLKVIKMFTFIKKFQRFSVLLWRLLWTYKKA